MGCRLSTASNTIMACVRFHNFFINVDGIDNDDTVMFEQVKNMVHNGAVVRNDDGDPIGYLHSGMDDLEALQQQEGISRVRDAITYHIRENAWQRPIENILRNQDR